MIFSSKTDVMSTLEREQMVYLEYCKKQIEKTVILFFLTTKSLLSDHTKSSIRQVLGVLERCFFRVNWKSYYVSHFLIEYLVSYFTLNIIRIRINFCDLYLYSIKTIYLHYLQGTSTTSKTPWTGVTRIILLIFIFKL